MKHIIDDADKNKYEAFTKEEVLEVIQEAISSGELPDEINGLVLRFKNPVDNQSYKIAFCTQAKYNELESGGQLEANCIYYITDDTTLEDLEDAIDDLNDRCDSINNQVTTNTNDINTLKPKYINGYYDDEDGLVLSNLQSLTDMTDLKGYVIKIVDYFHGGEFYLNYTGYEESTHTDYTSYSNTFIGDRYELVITTYSNGDDPSYVYELIDAELRNRVTILERKHLYKHDIKIKGTGFSAIFTIYTNSADVLDTASKIGAYMKSGTGDLASPSINAGGYVADNNNICNIQYVFYSSGSLTASYTRYNNGSWDSYNQSLSTGTIYDGVTQIL